MGMEALIMSDDTREIRFKFVYPDDYNPVFANGVWGGVTPKGELNMNFFLERHPVPKSVYHGLNEDGTMGQETRRDPEKRMYIRYLVAGVVMNYGEAKSFHAWLTSKLEEIETKFGPADVAGSECDEHE
jgi:hypothetical protein